jgi:hypothetical protein
MYVVMILFMIGMWVGVVRVEIVDVRKYPPYCMFFIFLSSCLLICLRTDWHARMNVKLNLALNLKMLILGLVPYRTHVTFQEDSRYDANRRGSIDLWKDVTFNQGLGVLYFQNAEKYGLPPSDLTQVFKGFKEYNMYSIAMFHQLHCLVSISQFL